MTIIRPVTQLFPQSITISEESGLPFACIITPFGENSSPNSNESTETLRKTDEKNGEDIEAIPSALLPADSVPKCNICGAPLNPYSLIQSYPSEVSRSMNSRRNGTRSTYANGGNRDENYDGYDELDDEEFENDDGRYGSFFCSLCGNYTSFHPIVQAPLHPSPWGNEIYTSRFQSNAQSINLLLDERYRELIKSGRWQRSMSLRRKELNQHEDTNYIHKHVSPKMYPECHNQMMEYSVPLFPRSSTNDELIMEMNAADCPTILTFLICDHNPSLNFQSYYPSICQTIRHTLKTAPTHAKIGIFLASYENLTLFDLASSIPHLKHVRLPNNQMDITELNEYEDSDNDVCNSLDWNQIYVSCTPENKSNIESILRALEDPLVVSGACRPFNSNEKDHDHKKSSNDAEEETNLQVNLGKVLNMLFHLFECGTHPGDLTSTIPMTPGEMVDDINIGDSFIYAGGKIMVFLPEAPLEVGELVVEHGGHVGTGGFGGSCHRVGQRFVSDNIRPKVVEGDGVMNIEEEEELVMTKSMDYYLVEKADVANMYYDLGARSASLALGIEIFGICARENKAETKCFGFPLLRLLSNSSGGCGPLLFCIDETNGCTTPHQPGINGMKESGDGGTLEALLKEVLVRCPWERPCAFGGLLRIRTSPSFAVETAQPTDIQSEDGTKSTRSHNRFHKSGGMIGPCIANPLDKDLWHFGVCDLETTLAFDMEIISSTGMLEDAFVERDGERLRNLPPCMQSCFMYTAVVSHEGEFKTVRRLRVLTKKLSIAENTEQLSMSLDADVLAVVLFHKMVSSSLLVGLRETRILGQNWLLAALLATYRSAERHYAEQQSRRYDYSTDNIPFYTHERLLPDHYPNKQSVLSSRDILLGQGHDSIAALPLMLFSLLHCDAIRPATVNGFTPSLDARVAAASNMAIMPPVILAKAIAPGLELWSENGKEKQIERIRMSRQALKIALENEGNGPRIFFLDSPWQIMLFGNGDKVKNIENSLLYETVKEAAGSYRVMPPININGNCSIVSAWDRFSDALFEDLDMDTMEMDPDNGLDNSYEFWCTKIANILYDDIMSGDDKNNIITE